MVKILTKDEIVQLLSKVDVVQAMKEAFIAYSNDKAVVPPVGELLFDEPKGEMHLKYGYIKEDDYAVVKVASGFYDNSALGISSSQGLILLFSQKTGRAKAVLLDDGYLTDIRTAAAGALVAHYFAPSKISAIGLIGAGIQARQQLRFLQRTKACKKVWIWNRDMAGAEQLKRELDGDFEVQLAPDTATLAAHSNLIVTNTPSERPLLFADHVQPGTHITAVGSDTPIKQELDSAILGFANVVVADSLPQSRTRGEVFRAVSSGALKEDCVLELGAAIQNPKWQRQNDDQITVVDLTGVAVQDIMIAKAVYECSLNKKQ